MSLHVYQRHAADKLVADPRHGLLLPPGLGKTLITLTAFSELRESLEIARALVVAPLRVIYSTWPEEVKKWTPDLRVHNFHQERTLTRDADLYLINPEGLPWLFGREAAVETANGVGGKTWKPGVWETWQNRPEMLVVDESTLIKSVRSRRFKTLARYIKDFSRRTILTGTPTPNGIMDLFGQMYILDGGEALGKKISHFREQYFRTDLIGARGKKFPKYTAHDSSFDRIKERIAPRVTALAAEDWLTMPDKIVTEVPVVLDPEILKLYRDAKAAVVLEDGQQLLPGHVSRMKQIAGGRVYETSQLSTERTVIKVHDKKIEALQDLLAEINAPTLVAYEFQAEADALSVALKAPVISGGMKPSEANRLIDRWNAGRLPVLLVQPQALSHGVNLQAGGSNMVWVTLPWSLELYQQLCARLHRQGQTAASVMIYHLVAQGTIDQRVSGVLSDKNATQEMVLAALKAEIGGEK